MMGIMVPETCRVSNKICNKYHLLHLVGILFPHITTMHGQNHFKLVIVVVVLVVVVVVVTVEHFFKINSLFSSNC